MKKLYDQRCPRDWPVDNLTGYFVALQAILFLVIGLL